MFWFKLMTRSHSISRGQDRPRNLARMLALLAMLMQILVSTAHIAGAAPSQADAERLDPRFAFLEICTGHGIEVLSPASNSSTAGSSACAVCTSACVFGFDQPVPAGGAVPAAFTELDLEVPSAFALHAWVRALSDGPIRAPPARTV
ncbi:hypothetical protein [Phaeovulum sp.]|uniref:hypothetical protein n=1 Tax=Phaeovulum sp. TaxID=2934796 RepID=UPI00356964AA